MRGLRWHIHAAGAVAAAGPAAVIAAVSGGDFEVGSAVIKCTQTMSEILYVAQ